MGLMPAHCEPDEYFLEPRAVRRAFDAAAATFDAAAGVHAEIRKRLLERLDLVRLQPQLILDLGGGTGHASRALKERYRAAGVIALDASLGMLRQAAHQRHWLRRFARVAGDAHRLPLKDASVDLVFSNLMLQWCNDPDAVFREIRRVLRPGGLLMFTTLGPDTLQELRRSWRTIDGGIHVHRFLDMHDLGDALLRAGLAEPVMDTERLTVTYPTLPALMDELKATGSCNLAWGRRAGLTPRRQLEQLKRVAAALAQNGPVAMTVEVVSGQAWASTGQTRPESTHEFRVPVPMVRRRRAG